MFTRVLSDRSHRFDEVGAGYEGTLYLEVVPRTFAIRVQTGLALNQVRLMVGDGRLDDLETLELHARTPLLFLDSRPLQTSELSVSGGLFLSLDVSGDADTIVGYRAKKNSLPIDLTGTETLRWRDYWEPVHPERGGRIVLEPEIFYLLLSAEGVGIPPTHAAEMLAYDPTAGELRTHYAGFFDPGFGYAGEGPAGQPGRARGPRPRRLLHGRAPPAGLQAGLRAHGRGARRPLRQGHRLQLPGPADDAQQALPARRPARVAAPTRRAPYGSSRCGPRYRKVTSRTLSWLSICINRRVRPKPRPPWGGAPKRKKFR